MKTPSLQTAIAMVTASAVSGAYVLDMRGVDRASLALLVSGASLGTSTITLKYSLDNVTFFTFATSKTLAVSGSTNGAFELGSIDYPFLQISWTTPSAGVITIAGQLYAVPTTVQLN